MNNLQQYLIPLAIVIAGALVAGGIFFGGKQAQKNPAVTNGGVQSAVAITSDRDPFVGNPNAPVTLYYWSDYQCPFCKQFETTSLQTAIKDYVANNKVKVVFKDLQFLGQDSIESAHIARAIWELYPDKYYAWREGYFAKQDDEGDVGFGDKASVIAYTKTVSGIDADKVSALADSKADEYQTKIEADGAQASGNGVQGTPGVIISSKAGTQFVSNPLNYATLKAVIDAVVK